MIGLKPCPFCGGDASIGKNIKMKNYYGEDIVGSVAYCTVCNAEMFCKSERIAIIAWNRRANEQTN